MSVTVFMIRRAAYSEFNAFLKTLGNGVSTIGGINGVFYPIPSRPERPAWVNALSGKYIPATAAAGLVSQSPAGILTCRINGKLFAVCFGHGWMKLSNDWVDHSFGRRVVLNSIAEDDLRQLRSEQVLANRHRSIERSPSSAKLNDFGYESDRDLVFSVEGFCRVPPFLGVVRGGAPVRFDVDISLFPRAIFAASTRLGRGYQSKFPDIDSLVPVTLRDDVTAMDHRLDEEMSGGNVNNLVGLTPPASLEVFDQDVYFSYGRWKEVGHARSWALAYSEWTDSLAGAAVSLATAESSKVHVVDAATGRRKTSVKIRDALSFDFVRKDGHYVIFSGKWYRASPNLSVKLDAFLGSLVDSAFPPPIWNGRDDEGTYNHSACVADARLVHMDARNIFYGGGQSKFEFCDFLDPVNKVLYFVKNPCSAAGMSHLYEQARRTTELFFGNNRGYVEKLRIALLRHRADIDVSWLDVPPRGPEWEICLVSMGRAAADLPLFAKCGLMRVHRELSGRFRQVSYCVV
ncbi:TIGR04141 family sporadically distributed protein [Luteimonas sp. RD2P54]|uniref:TIGR04141 family sporadically distributed protein n=1 Tax=Luteimonas endophytica TaxID=3042023 RepID=A0ABT6JBT1_9GAMM|nr:TIGR04141 family sporadically distributed protein [Luteimonas endophytica]MDH5824283.1 TIGR04141 family sporadically distributed protein [Luteimonas endophytica]